MANTEKLLLQLAQACRILEMEGHGDMTLGHVSLRDPDGRGFWLKRNRIGLGEVLGPKDFILVSFQGEKLEGGGGRHSEWPIHSQILLRRPDVHVVAHTHAFHASVLSASGEPLLPFTLDADYFAHLPRDATEAALLTAVEDGDALASALGEHFAVLMANMESPFAAPRSNTPPVWACSWKKHRVHTWPAWLLALRDACPPRPRARAAMRK